MSRDTDDFTSAMRSPFPPEILQTCRRCGALHRAANHLAFHSLCGSCAGGDLSGAAGVRRFHALSERAIDDAIADTSPGTFTLGYLDGDDFIAFYVGRSDADLRASLHAWVDAPSHPRRHRRSSHASWRSRPGLPFESGTRALGSTGVGIDTAYTHFTFCYAPTAIAAFEKECRDYHALGGSDGLDNDRHPEPDRDGPWSCPLHGGVQ